MGLFWWPSSGTGAFSVFGITPHLTNFVILISSSWESCQFVYLNAIIQKDLNSITVVDKEPCHSRVFVHAMIDPELIRTSYRIKYPFVLLHRRSLDAASRRLTGNIRFCQGWQIITPEIAPVVRPTDGLGRGPLLTVYNLKGVRNEYYWMGVGVRMRSKPSQLMTPKRRKWQSFIKTTTPSAIIHLLETSDDRDEHELHPNAARVLCNFCGVCLLAPANKYTTVAPPDARGVFTLGCSCHVWRWRRSDCRESD